MKVAVIVLAVVLVILGIVYLNTHRTAQERERKLETVTEQLTVTSNALTTARGEVHEAETKLQEQTQRAEGLEQSVQTLTTARAETEKQSQALQQQLATAEHLLEEEKARVAVVEGERNKLQEKLGAVSSQLDAVEKKLADLQRAHQGTEVELEALRQQRVALEAERNSLTRKLNDLASLKAQLRTVRREQWEQKIAEWRNRDAAAMVGGNKGLLFSQGHWQIVPATVQP